MKPALGAGFVVRKVPFAYLENTKYFRSKFLTSNYFYNIVYLQDIMAKATKKAVGNKKVNPRIRTKAATELDDVIEHYSRINVPIFSEELINNIDFKSIPNFKASLRELRSALDTKLKRTTDRIDTIEEIKRKFKDEKMVFVLGAGVSMAYSLPSWDTLLQKLMVTTLERDKNASSILSKLFSRIFKPSPLIAGRYLQKYFEDNNQSFEEAVRTILYEEIKRDTPSLLMDEIVKFCIAPGRTPNLNSIITYNFDDLLEQSIRKKSVDLPFKSVFGQGIDVEIGELPIYHVHGYLPEKEAIDKTNQITFGESIYHKQYTDTYSWNNIVQINKFRDNNCLFIGTSLTDPNTRRLLDISNQQRNATKGYHYIFKLKYKKEEVTKALELTLTQNQELLDEKAKANLQLDDTVDTLIETVESFEENDLYSFGIKTIWIDKYSEIPEILKDIRALK